MDYYELLGVPRNATESDLKKAYKKQSMQHHPDRNGGSDSKFKEINEAYSALKDPQKRQMYDQYGTADPQQAQAQQQSHFSQQKIFLDKCLDNIRPVDKCTTKI